MPKQVIRNGRVYDEIAEIDDMHGELQSLRKEVKLMKATLDMVVELLQRAIELGKKKRINC